MNNAGKSYYFFMLTRVKKSITFCKGLVIPKLYNFRTLLFEKNACWIFDRVQIALAHKSHMPHWLQNLSFSLWKIVSVPSGTAALLRLSLAALHTTAEVPTGMWVSGKTKVHPLSWGKTKLLGDQVATGTGKSKEVTQTHPGAPLK